MHQTIHNNTIWPLDILKKAWSNNNIIVPELSLAKGNRRFADNQYRNQLFFRKEEKKTNVLYQKEIRQNNIKRRLNKVKPFRSKVFHNQ